MLPDYFRIVGGIHQIIELLTRCAVMVASGKATWLRATKPK